MVTFDLREAARHGLGYRVDDKSLERAESELAGWSDPVTRLREALQKNEFELYCQPIVALVPDGQLSMAEVLVRLYGHEQVLVSRLLSELYTAARDMDQAARHQSTAQFQATADGMELVGMVPLSTSGLAGLAPPAQAGARHSPPHTAE